MEFVHSVTTGCTLGKKKNPAPGKYRTPGATRARCEFGSDADYAITKEGQSSLLEAAILDFAAWTAALAVIPKCS